MTRNEMLLTILTEECAEVTQRITKALRFGMDECEPEQGLTNKERLVDEINDLYAVVLMLRGQGVIPEHWYSTQKEKLKREKVEKYLNYSQQCGTLAESRSTGVRRLYAPAKEGAQRRQPPPPTRFLPSRT